MQMRLDHDQPPVYGFPASFFVPTSDQYSVAADFARLSTAADIAAERWDSELAELDSAMRVALHAAYNDGDTLARLDIQKVLFLVYELSFVNPSSGVCCHERKPWVSKVREQIEAAWLGYEITQATSVSFQDCRDWSVSQVLDWFQTAASEETPIDLMLLTHLEHDATLEEMKAFVLADAPLNFRFFDALVLSMSQYLDSVKAEMSRHVWEEGGQGGIARTHTQQFLRTLSSLALTWDRTPGWTDWRPFAGYNLHFCLGLARRHYFKAVGSLAMPELFDARRDRAIVRGFERLGFVAERDIEFYWNHMTADEEHGPAWLHGVVEPIVRAQPEAIPDLVLGAALRMAAMRQFNAYLCSLFALTSAAAGSKGETSS